MRINLIIILLITCCLVYSCGKEQSISLQTKVSDTISAQDDKNQETNDHIDNVTHKDEESEFKVHLKNTLQETEIIKLKKQISDAGIEKFLIKNMKPGSLKEIIGGVGEKKLLIWNSAGHRLYPSVAAAQTDGFAVWEFGPDSEAAKQLDKIFINDGGYHDDILYIWWEGLEFAVSK